METRLYSSRVASSGRRKAVVVIGWPVSFAHRLALEQVAWCHSNGFDDVQILDLSRNYFVLKACFPSVAIPSSYWKFFLKHWVKRRLKFGWMVGKVFSVRSRHLFFERNVEFKDRDIKLIVDSNSVDSSVNEMSTDQLEEMYTFLLHFREIFEGFLEENSMNFDVNNTSWFIFNGRFPFEAIVRQVLHRRQATVYFFESGPRDRTMEIYQESPFSHEERREIMSRHWINGDFETRTSTAEEFMRLRMRGLDETTIFWTKHQELSSTIEILEGRQLVTFFASTEGELASYDYGKKIPLFSSQSKALQWLCNSLDANRYVLCVREHPLSHSHGKRSALAGVVVPDKLEVIHISGDSKISSLRLLEESVLNVVYDSTIAADSILRQKPTLILGRPIFAVHFQESISMNDLERDFVDFSRFSYPISNLHVWAFYCASGGIPFQN